MAEDSDYTPGAWKGHDFKEAKSYYDSSAGRSYAAQATQAQAMSATGLVPARISTQSTSPLVVMVDVTGSMGAWPKTMFSKLPYLDLEGKEYLGPDMEISFAANTDLNDAYPLHIREFKTGVVLKDELASFVVGGGAGPDSGCEAYEIGAAYYAYNVDMSNAVRPIFIFVADEQPHAHLSRSTARDYAKVDLPKDSTVDEVFAALKAKYSVYLVHKSYSPQSRNEWVRLLGEDHVADLEDPERVVDVIFGILARETGRVDYFRTEIEQRQEVGTAVGAKKVATVYKALGTIHAASPAAAASVGGKSTMHKPSGGKPTKSLI